jgi:Telomerase ribonucleoprotein complex - RNA binding domain
MHQIPWIYLKIKSNDILSVENRLVFYLVMTWLWDKFVPALIGGHFFVTETAFARNQLFYFRHDIWLQISKNSLQHVRRNLFFDVPLVRQDFHTSNLILCIEYRKYEI